MIPKTSDLWKDTRICISFIVFNIISALLRKILSIIIVLFCCQTLHSQVVIGSVTDANYNSVGFATVVDTVTQKQSKCDFSGTFVLTVTDKSILKISHPEFETKVFSVQKTEPLDTIVLNFKLTRKVQLIPEVIVTSERLRTVTDQTNTNVVDYLPFDDFVLVVKTSKSGRMLSVEGIDTTLREFDLGKIKARKIVKDCYGNVHLLSKDSSYQIWMDSTLHFVSSSSIEQYNRLLQPCVANFSETNVFENFTKRNRKYTVTAIEKKTKAKHHFFHLHDEVGESVARSYYWSIISYYFQHIPEHKNMIVLGVWNGDLLSLNYSDPEFDQMIIWYLKIRAVKLNIQTFQDGNRLLVFDQFSDSIRIFDDQNKKLRELPYDFAKGANVFPVIQDRYTGIFYDLSISNGVYTVTSITPAYDETISPRKLTLSEVPFATNIKIYNDWVYFLIEQKEYYGLYRIKIPNSFAPKQDDK